MSIRVRVKDHPHRAIALETRTHALIFRHSPSSTDAPGGGLYSGSQVSLSSNGSGSSPRCMVEFAEAGDVDLSNYRNLTPAGVGVSGTLGLITLNKEVFLCVVSQAARVAEARPGETVQRILGVDFYCLSSTQYDHVLNDQINPYPTDYVDEEGFDYGYNEGRKDGSLEHPCLALKKLLSSGTFYYSADFDLTRRLQDRSGDAPTVAIDSLKAGFLWNSYMIQPLVNFRSRLSQREKTSLDRSGFLTSAIRGFALTIKVPPSSSPARAAGPRSGLPSHLTLISRLSCRRAGTRFNARGIDDDGNVANFVESETVYWSPSGSLTFSYVQVRGSVPVFWEQQSGLIPGQQKISVTRSAEATQPAFDLHFEDLGTHYGAVHIVNLLSNERPGEVELTQRYHHHITRSSLNRDEKGALSGSGHELLKETNYDFNAETRGPSGYEAAAQVSRWIQDSADSFAYLLSEDIEERPSNVQGNAIDPSQPIRRSVVVLQQEGVFRTNCLDCLDRTNLVQTNISRMAFEAFLEHRSDRANSDFWVRHSSLWADNGDALSRIYAGTGALKSSFTRHGKMSLAGALADARKSATRMYINNFADKGRQNTIDMLLGRLIGQSPVHLYDPINDYVTAELARRSGEYSSKDIIRIWSGTFNLNGKGHGVNEDLSSWLCPPNIDEAQQNPEIVAVGFQEIVELSPQQIMSTDPARRQAWELAVKKTLNEHAQKTGSEEYVLLRGGQLVGASLSIFVKASVLRSIKNVEGSVKKTGMSGIAGNKGAVAIRMDYASTSICFVTAHLAAGFANYEERNRDYKTISNGLRFQRNRAIDDHDTVVWLGDFNYRIGLDNEEVRKCIQMGNLERLYDNDQLNIQMVNGLTFPYYAEGRITFDPTYKYDNGTDKYDTSDKARIPAWCDRILWKGDNLRQTTYYTAPLRFSDHRPVYALFLCMINVVDEKKRDELSNALYLARKSAVGNNTANADDVDTEDEDLIGYEAVEPGLPPASSDKRKWWLDNGLPARSTLQPPNPTSILNPARPSNPFTQSPHPTWIDKSQSRPSLPQHDRLESSSGMSSSATLPQRKLPPPYNPSLLDGGVNGPTRSRARSPSSTSTRSLPIHPAPLHQHPSGRNSPASSVSSVPSRKPAPPIPKKPSQLSSTSPSHAASATDALGGGFPPPPRRAATEKMSPSARTAPAPPPPRGSSSKNERRTNEPEVDEAPPRLPPRRTGTGLSQASSQASGPGLLDDEDDSGLNQLRGWEALKPG
ncbi:SacI homology domain-containing protein [Lineolata rhizophorae]|uniref:phosphoinositide 5-phosphatase n=1 Tax=Lineolata rhizophorae TaxID=578093 RepID=A0A6A6NUL8_9PEZI|nr:SacI homology domain-containing protein [Lineolata rhizophorae]